MSQIKVNLFIACSLDGYISKPNDDLSFLNIVEKEGEDYGYADFKKTIDTIVIGRRTYDWVMKQPDLFDKIYRGYRVYIITRNQDLVIKGDDDSGNIQYWYKSLHELVDKLKKNEEKDQQQQQQTIKNIYCDGGSEVIHELLKEKLIDEMTISIVPVLLGCGIRLFREGFPEQSLQLLSSNSFEKGLVQLKYKIIK